MQAGLLFVTIELFNLHVFVCTNSLTSKQKSDSGTLYQPFSVVIDAEMGALLPLPLVPLFIKSKISFVFASFVTDSNRHVVPTMEMRGINRDGAFAVPKNRSVAASNCFSMLAICDESLFLFNNSEISLVA